MTTDPAIITAVLATIGTIIAAWLSYRSSKIQKQFEQEQRVWEISFTSLQSLVQSLQDRIKHLEERYEVVQTTLSDERRAWVKERVEIIQTYEERLAAMRTELEEMRNQLYKQITDYQQMHQALMVQYQQLQQEYQNIHAKLQETQTELEQLINENAALKALVHKRRRTDTI